MTWIVLQTYYKDGKYNLMVMENDIELRNFLESVLFVYENMNGVRGEFEKYKELLKFNSLDELIQFTVEEGNKIAESEGWGVRKIIKV